MEYLAFIESQIAKEYEHEEVATLKGATPNKHLLQLQFLRSQAQADLTRVITVHTVYLTHLHTSTRRCNVKLGKKAIN